MYCNLFNLCVKSNEPCFWESCPNNLSKIIKLKKSKKRSNRPGKYFYECLLEEDFLTTGEIAILLDLSRQKVRLILNGIERKFRGIIRGNNLKSFNNLREAIIKVYSEKDEV